MLQGIVKAHPELGAVHYGVGQLLARMGQLDEAAAAFDRAEQGVARQPSGGPGAQRRAAADGQAGLAKSAGRHGHRARGARHAADRVAAHESAARVALALKDAAAATTHAAVSAEVDPDQPRCPAS